jgi:hypothetical protein
MAGLLNTLVVQCGLVAISVILAIIGWKTGAKIRIKRDAKKINKA